MPKKSPTTEKGATPSGPHETSGRKPNGDEGQSWLDRATETTKSGLNRVSNFSLLSFSGPVETISILPGRVRFRANTIVRNSAVKDGLIENLQKIKAVNSVEVNVVSGSVLIHYDPEVISPELLFAAILKLLDLESEFLSTPEPVLASEIKEMGRSLNRAVYELTGGFTDFHTALLIGLGLYGIYLFRTSPLRAFPGGFTLMWWAYMSIFSKA